MSTAMSKTYQDWVNEAVTLERKARWSEATQAWAEARRASKHESTQTISAERAFVEAAEVADEWEEKSNPHWDLSENGEPTRTKKDPKDTPNWRAYRAERAHRERERAKSNNLTVGATLYHFRHGKVLATCLYRGVCDWFIDGKSFASISAAATYATQQLSKSVKTPRSVNGWHFWGVEPREEAKTTSRRIRGNYGIRGAGGVQ